MEAWVMWRRLLLSRGLRNGLLLSILLPVASLFALGWLSQTPPLLGVYEGKLLPCPDKPNCVSSERDPLNKGENREHPLPLGALPLDSALARLKVLLFAEGARLIEEEGDYLRVAFTSPFFGFVDDFEARLDRVEGVIHLRAASRVGRSDFGANRKRIQRIRASFEVAER